MKKNVKVLVAGGTGFLGSHIVKKLTLSRVNFVSASLSQGTDFRNFEQTKSLMKKYSFDYVINCAAFVGGISYGYEKPGELFLNNTLMSTNLIEASRLTGVKRFINPISNCSYPGHLINDFKEEDWWSGELHESVLTYGFVRKASWVQLWSYYKQYGMESMNLILPNMYGPNDHFNEKRSHALGALIKKMVDAKNENQKEVIVWGTGSPIREWLYVEDGADALIKSLSADFTIQPINIGVGKGISVKELAFLIKEVVGYSGKLVFDPTKPDGAPHKIMNVKRMIKHLMGWQPPTKLKDGITKTIEWYTHHLKGS